MIEQVVTVLNVVEPDERETNIFDQMKYILIDDPVSSLDENHLIEMAVDLACLIKSSESDIKFLVTTHNPLFYNVLYNELRKNKYKKYILVKYDDGSYDLKLQSSDTPFSYHLHLKTEIEKALDTGEIYKYHFNYLRNIFEKTSTFLGYENWGDLLSPIRGDRKAYERRLINISSHSKHAGEEVTELSDDDKRVLKQLMDGLNDSYRFQ